MTFSKTFEKSVRFFCKSIPKKEKRIVYHSFPDFSDNSFAMFVYISNHFVEYENIWLVKDVSIKEKYFKLASNYTKTDNLLIVKKNSFKGIYYYLTAKTIFHTHGVFGFFGLNKKQKKINLWHGMPLKKVGYLDRPRSKSFVLSDYHIATSPLYQDIISKIFRAPKESVFIVGQPRNDFIFDNTIGINQLFNKQKQYKKTVLWMPTYRKSVIGDIRNDGSLRPETDFLSKKSLGRINNIFKQFDSVCYLKIHPMDFMQTKRFNKYSNIDFIVNEDFEKRGISMYSILNSIDILLTDFSSIYIDFLLLNKPIGFVFSDYEEFKNSRGFIFENPLEYMAGEIITGIDQLECFFKKVIEHNNDEFVTERKKLKDLFHSKPNNYSKLIYQKVLKSV